MAANTAPIFVLTPNVGWAQGALTANTTADLTSGTIYLLFTAGANGAWVEDIRIKAIGTNVATLVRFWINNGATTGTASNNTFIDEYAAAASTASNFSPQAFGGVVVRRMVPAAYRIYATVVTGIAAGVDITCFGGDY